MIKKITIFFFLIKFEILFASPWLLNVGEYQEMTGDLRLKIEEENKIKIQIGDSDFYYHLHLKAYARVRNEYWFEIKNLIVVKTNKPIDPVFLTDKKKSDNKKLVLGNIQSKEDHPVPAMLPALNIYNKFIFVTGPQKIFFILFDQYNIAIQTHYFKKI